jgi:crotonobetainyl-CoA:carnitine CoA-transferase CaiB-like acyl-CoA transferase
LYARERTGRGQRVEVSLLGSLLAGLVNQASGLLNAGVVPGRMGNRHPSIAPYETLRAQDGPFAVAVGNQAQFERFCTALGLSEVGAGVDARGEAPADRPDVDALGADRDKTRAGMDETRAGRDETRAGRDVTRAGAGDDALGAASRIDPRFRDNPARVANRDVLIQAIEAVTTTEPAQHWIDLLGAAKVPCGPVNDLAQAFDLAERLGLNPVVELGDTKTVASPIRLSETPVSYRLPPPTLPKSS